MRLLCAILLGAVVLGCAPAASYNIADPDPLFSIPAIKSASRSQDAKRLEQLVNALESDDPAVRLYAINSLERVAGQRFGYECYHSEEQRRPAVLKWRQWLKDRQPTTAKQMLD